MCLWVRACVYVNWRFAFFHIFCIILYAKIWIHKLFYYYFFYRTMMDDLLNCPVSQVQAMSSVVQLHQSNNLTLNNNDIVQIRMQNVMSMIVAFFSLCLFHFSSCCTLKLKKKKKVPFDIEYILYTHTIYWATCICKNATFVLCAFCLFFFLLLLRLLRPPSPSFLALLHKHTISMLHSCTCTYTH